MAWVVDFFLKKKTYESINNKMAWVIKGGNYTLGYEIVLDKLRSYKGELFIHILN